jgi:polar amino acid transport system substrate-binding protein
VKKIWILVSLLVTFALLLSACGGQAQAVDLLAQIKQRGTIVVSTDPNYEPQSFINTNGKRLTNTKCATDQLTSAEMQGFDVDVAVELGKRLGVETCFATPNWDAITAGNWADKWDISVGSMTVTTDRQKILEFSPAYYYTPAMLAVLKDSGFTKLDDLAGKAICAGSSTTYETWLNSGPMGLPATSIYAKPPAGITVVPLDTDQECAQALTSGRKDFVAYITSATVIDANIAAGMPVMKLGSTVYSEDLAVAVDKKHTLPIATLMDAINKIITDMHSDGTLSTLSTKWFKSDLTVLPK